MTNKSKKQTAKQKRILVASILLAGMIVAGGTFAWFTSKDEVTNKLTASSDYGVSITEDFTPPSDWTPGQVVNKDVSVVNTGNVDAFVKVSLSNTLDQTNLSTIYEDENSKLVALSADEVKALQAGGRLIAIDGEPVSEEEEIVGTDFAPTKSGSYVFLRDVDYRYYDDDDQTLWTAYTYAGYYYDLDKNEYYPVTVSYDETDNNYSVELLYELTTKDGSMTFDLDENDNVVVYKDNDGNDYLLVSQGTIKIRIYLDADYATNWTLDTVDREPVFYYNNTVKAGETSRKLIDSLELDDSVSTEDYRSFEYYLNIIADSVQVVTPAEGGKKTAEAVTAEWEITPTLSYNDDDTISSVAWSFSSDSENP